MIILTLSHRATKLTPTLLLPALLLCGFGTISAADAGSAPAGPSTAAASGMETATTVGTVTARDPEHKAFTLKDDDGGDSNDYRAYFRDGNPQHVLDQIAALSVGDRLEITYTEREGRRVISMHPAPKPPSGH